MGGTMSEHQRSVGKKYWKKSHGAWYCHILHPDGRDQDRRLDPDEETAEGIRQEIIKEIRKAGRPSLDCTVDHLIQNFLSYAEDNNAPATYKWYSNFLSWPSRTRRGIATLLVRDLRLHHVQNWLKGVSGHEQPEYPARRHRLPEAALQLGRQRHGYFDAQPFGELRKPQRTHRDTCPTRDQWEEVLMPTTTRTTPSRTSSRSRRLPAAGPRSCGWSRRRQINLGPAGLIHFADGEIPGKKFGRDVLVPDRDVVLKRLALKHPQGPVFRNEDGNPWTKERPELPLPAVEEEVSLQGQLLRRSPLQGHGHPGKRRLGRGRGHDPRAPRPDRGAAVLWQAY